VRTKYPILFVLFASFPTAPVTAQEATSTSKIVAVDLFKNGLCVVKREATLPRAGTYLLSDVPQPVHGTYWVESAVAVESAVKMRDVAVPTAETLPSNLQDDLAGKAVVIHLKGEKAPAVSGTVMALKPKDEERVRDANRFLVVKTGRGRTFVDVADIATVETEAADTVTRKQPVLALTVPANAPADTKVTIRYLARGLAWAPSYKIDITDPKKLTLEQHAVVKNELEKLDGAEMHLISGYPSVQFAHVTSPLAARTTLGMFFSELGSGAPRYGAAMSQLAGNSVVMNQAVAFNPVAPGGAELGAVPTGEGVDLHYQSIGKRTLAEGESLALRVANGTADYLRIVEWLVQDTRDEYGSAGRRGGRGEDPQTDDDVAWDALRFKNPLPFPMTTGPAMVVSGGRFNGQRTSYWTNAGEETVLRVEKALSVRTRAIENEESKKADGTGGRDTVYVGRRQYRSTVVDGELTANNHRKEDVTLVIRRRFSGDLISADGEPKKILREEGVYSVNKRYELIWTLTLKPGEEKKLAYKYSVLVGD
jgi:hypothetical protein